MTADEIFALPVHPSAQAFTMLAPDELQALADDIHEYGLHNPLIVSQGQLVDGRNRRDACRLAGVEPTIVELDPSKDVDAFIWSQNSTRRQISQGARAMAYALIFPEKGKAGRPKAGQEQSPTEWEIKGLTREQVRMARDVIAVFTKDADIVDQVKRGGSLTQAYGEAQQEKARRSEDDAAKEWLRAHYPNFAEKVSAGEWTLAFASAMIEADRVRHQKEEEAAERRKRLKLMIESIGPEVQIIAPSTMAAEPVVDIVDQTSLNNTMASFESAEKQDDTWQRILGGLGNVQRTLEQVAKMETPEPHALFAATSYAAVRSACAQIANTAIELREQYQKVAKPTLRQVK